jgi:uncharacterized protein (TIGR03790 family)
VGRITDAAERAAIEQTWEQLWADMQKPVELPVAQTTASTAPTPALPVTSGGLNFGSALARRNLRIESRREGAVRLEQLLALQADFLSVDQSDASVDSELATVRWGAHVRAKWQRNAVHYTLARVPEALRPPMVMVCRLDGPSVEAVKRLIDDSIATEQTGLSGKAILDSWAKPEKKPDGTPDGYGLYDESIRRLERLLSTTAQGRVSLLFEATDQLIPENSQRDIAIYCGWYDPNRVVLPGTFARGAVGFHIASYTAVGLRQQGGGWWTPALLAAGVCGTIGPVSEPYLSAFPPADEFFPLLLTGELTLAEVYWRTCPMVSWKMLLIGDPLYRPYAMAPVLSRDELPERLRQAISDN